MGWAKIHLSACLVEVRQRQLARMVASSPGGVHGGAGALLLLDLWLTTQLPPRLLGDADGSDARAALSNSRPRRVC